MSEEESAEAAKGLLAKTDKPAKESKTFRMTWRLAVCQVILMLAGFGARVAGAEPHWLVEPILAVSLGTIGVIYVGGQKALEAIVAGVTGWLGKRG